MINTIILYLISIFILSFILKKNDTFQNTETSLSDIIVQYNLNKKNIIPPMSKNIQNENSTQFCSLNKFKRIICESNTPTKDKFHFIPVTQITPPNYDKINPTTDNLFFLHNSNHNKYCAHGAMGIYCNNEDITATNEFFHMKQTGNANDNLYHIQDPTTNNFCHIDSYSDEMICNNPTEYKIKLT